MKIYLDTSVYSGYYDEAQAHHTRLLFDLINTRKINVVTSQFVREELSKAKDERKRNAMDLIDDYKVLVPNQAQNESIDALVAAYLRYGVLTKNSLVDATHIAIATLLDVTAVVSNNMRHMVKRQDRFNVVNLRLLGKTIKIEKPEYILQRYEQHER